VGSCEAIGDLLGSGAPAWARAIACVPEFLRLGAAIETFMKADRIVIGCDNSAVAGRIAALYEPLGRPIAIMDVRSAEMAKHASNAWLAASISFINEIADLCEAAGARVDEVVRAMKLDRRIGPHAFLAPGLGFAGGTLGRDVRALQQVGDATATGTPFLDTVMGVNAARARLVVERLRRHHRLPGMRVAVLGLTYKPGTSTLRRSVALEVIRELVAAGADVRACDPNADFTDAPDLPDFAMRADAYAAAEGADAVVLMTEWPALRDVDLNELGRRMRGDLLFDTRGFFDAAAVAAAGLTHFRIGHPPPRASAGGPEPLIVQRPA
jgi:UDPglucose 6-dehydrogenase